MHMGRPRLLLFVSLLVIAVAAAHPLSSPRDAGAQTPSGQVTLDGWFHIQWIDPSPGYRGGTMEGYFLQDDKLDAYTLLIDDALLQRLDPAALDRKRVVVTGESAVHIGRPAIVVSSITLEGGDVIGPPTPQPPVVGSYPWAVLLCRYGDSTGEPPFDPADVEPLFGEDEPSVESWYEETSWQQMDLEGSAVFGWYTLPHPRLYYGDEYTGTYSSLLAQDCAAAADDDVNFPTFDVITVIVDQDLFCGCEGFATSFTLSFDSSTKNYGFTFTKPSLQMGLHAHEIGHTIGFPHSSGPYGQTYDSQWDVMSSLRGACRTSDTRYGCFPPGTIGYHKLKVGWMPAAHVFTPTPGSSTQITLYPLEGPIPSSGYLLAQIPSRDSASIFYTVETRRFIGYDEDVPLEGVLIHAVNTRRDLQAGHARVVDQDGDGDPNDAGAVLLPGESYLNTGIGFEVSVSAEGPDGSYMVTVDYDEQAPPPPSFIVTTLADGGAGSLRQVIADANQSESAVVITFAVTGTITLTSDPLPGLTGDLTIEGPGADDLTINANGLGRGLTVAAGAIAEVSGVTVTGASDAGIAVLGELMLSDSVVTGNTSATAGGGIDAFGGADVTLDGVTVSSNQSGTGGGIWANPNTTMVINDSLIEDNEATASLGGGIANYGDLTITDTTVQSNTGTTGGGGIVNGGSLQATGLTITDNHMSGNGAGGGLFNSGTATLTGALITDNQSGTTNSGGGVYNCHVCGGPTQHDDTTLDLIDSEVSGNHASTGAGINDVDASLALHNTYVHDNTATGSGGGIASGNGASVFVSEGSIIANNVANSGGGIAIGVGAGAEIELSTIRDNKANGTGGGISNSGTLNLIFSTVSGNSSGNVGNGPGAGLINLASATLSNVTIANNSVVSSNTGGGIFNCGASCSSSSTTLSLLNVTLSGNKAAQGANLENNSPAVASLTNVILASPVTSGNCGPTGITSLGHNLSSDSTCAASLSQPTDLNSTNPQLGTLADNGGDTETLALLSNSPAIDSGDNAACPELDQRFVPRGLDGDGNGTPVCDRGAFEYLRPDSDTDADGYLDPEEIGIHGGDPMTYCAIMRADVDGSGVVTIVDLGVVAQHFGEPVTPGTSRLNQLHNSNSTIDILDMAEMANHFLEGVSSCGDE